MSVIQCAGIRFEDQTSIECSAVIQNHKWSKIKSGWIFVNGLVYCPLHVPIWYEDWVAEKLMRKLETQLLIRIWE